jgi:nucleoside-triphosphatase THEP1
MKPTKIVILTGAIQSGKTTTLLRWCEHKAVGGFLTPVVTGKRMLFTLPDKVCAPFEADHASEESIAVGRYHLLNSAFTEINNCLVQQSQVQLDWLIVDEVGPLELSEKGCYAGLMHILSNSTNPLLCVVRAGLVQQVIDKFKLTDTVVVEKNFFAEK